MRARMLKINSLMRRELSQIIEFDLKNPHLGFITVMNIEVSKDLRHAKAFVSIMGNEIQKRETLQGLLKARSFIQKELGHRLAMKFMPDLKFIIDESLDYSMHIDEVLKKIRQQDAMQGGGVEKSE